jgi:short-subunit dehydrogenase
MSDSPTTPAAGTGTPAPLALVTGASSGIGLELARQFARGGFDLVVTAEDEALALAAEGLREEGRAVQAVRADLATYDGVEQLWAAVQATGRPVDAVALNAGVGVGGPFVETDLDDELRLIALNVTSTVHLAKRVTAQMAARGAGRVLVTSSIAARMPAPFQAVYGASKAFVQSFGQALRNELSDAGVSVTVVLPGPTETEFFDRAEMGGTRVAEMSKDDPEQVARQGYEALMDGKDHVVAGSLSTKVQGAAAAVTPGPVGAAAHRRLSEPGTGE